MAMKRNRKVGIRPDPAMNEVALAYLNSGQGIIALQEKQRKTAGFLEQYDWLTRHDIELLKILFRRELAAATGQLPQEEIGVSVMKLTEIYGFASSSQVSSSTIKLWKAKPQLIFKTLDPDRPHTALLRLADAGREIAKADDALDKVRWRIWEQTAQEMGEVFYNQLLEFFRTVQKECRKEMNRE